MKTKTLFVDDEAELLDQAERFLKKKDPELKVFTEESAEKGLKTFDERDIDVIISDYSMPGMSGIEFLKKIRENGYDTPFLILTGKGKEEVVMEAMQHGADGYLKKEGDPDTMYDLIVDAIYREFDRWKMEKELKDYREKIEDLHHLASELIACREEDKAYSLAMEAAESILDYDYCSIAETEDGIFKRKAISSNLDPENLPDREIEEGGIDRETWIAKEKFLIDDINETDKAEPVIDDHGFRSLISLPMDDIGVFHAISKRPGYFDEKDMKTCELLVSHLSNALKRIKTKQELERKEKLYRKIFETTGTAMALFDEKMKISLANEGFNRLFGFYDQNIENKHISDLVVKQDIPRIEQYCEDLKEENNGLAARFDMEVLTKRDKVKHVMVTLQYSPDVSRFVLSLLEYPK